MEYKDYYKIMGLSRNASADEIKRAYRKLARKYHPDVSKEPNAEEKFKELSEAYEVLRDTQKRSAYDQLGSNWQAGQEFRTPPGWQQHHQGGMGDGDFGDVSDFFESLFGGGRARGQHPHQRARSRQGEDYHGKLQISLEDACHGAVRQVTIPLVQHDQHGHQQVTNRKLNVKIPAGVKAGQQIRLAGQGGEGLGEGRKGDLYLEVEFQKHPLFDVVGNDIYCTVPIAPWEAGLGATIVVPTLAGKVDLKIPAGSQGGQKLRLKGRGLPGAAGDQYVILKIVIPHPVTDKAKLLYEEMAKEMQFNPREKMGVSA